MWGWLDNIVNALKSVWQSITDLPQTIIDEIKSIFVPNPQEIEAKFQGFVDELKLKFNFDTEFFESMFQGEGQAVTDINGEYNIQGVGKLQLKFLDTKYLIQGIEYFRPFIRGFIVLLMAFYNIKMLLSFIRQDAGIITGKGAEVGEHLTK